MKTFVVLLLVTLTLMVTFTFAIAGPTAQSPFQSAGGSGLIDGRGLG